MKSKTIVANATDLDSEINAFIENVENFQLHSSQAFACDNGDICCILLFLGDEKPKKTKK